MMRLISLNKAGCNSIKSVLILISPEKVNIAPGLLLFMALLLLFPAVAFSQSKKLVWYDEFDYNGHPDPSKWTYEEGFVRNNEPQYYTREKLKNARVENGNLVITAINERIKNPDYKTGSTDWRTSRKYVKYTSASLTTRGKYEFTYGRIEVKAKLPPIRNVWPAIWTLGSNIGEIRWPACGEIDIMEYWGTNPNTVAANVHTGDYNHRTGNGRGGKITVEKPWEDFHVFAVEWYPNRLDFYFNDEMYFSCEKKGEGFGEWPFDEPQYLLINLALTAGQDGIDDSDFPTEFLIDYVRIYELTDQ